MSVVSFFRGWKFVRSGANEPKPCEARRTEFMPYIELMLSMAPISLRDFLYVSADESKRSS